MPLTPYQDTLRQDWSFYKNKRVFLTGHTGFKGAWLARLLLQAGARVTGYALPPATPSLWPLLGLEQDMRSVLGDVRDFALLQQTYNEARPDLVFHLAAQPLVREGYQNPLATYATNLMGTGHLLECLRLSAGNSPRSFLNITTDKVYRNEEWPWGYRETDPLDGFDPYANSKSCAELITAAYARSFLAAQGVAVSTARAGNVIGGGDFAENRILPDCVRATARGAAIPLRNPQSIRPYQHVLDALSGYLRVAARQYADPALAGSYNVGPVQEDCVTTGQLADLFCAAWGPPARWLPQPNPGPHEASFLKLDCSKITARLQWQPRWGIREGVAHTVAWEQARLAGQDVRAVTDKQIAEYWRNTP